jgi:hypothetical protein
VLTYGGIRTGRIFPYVQIDSTVGGTGLGQATYKVSYDDGATFPHTGIPTAAGPVALPGVGSDITASFAAGPYNTNNIYQPLVTQISDLTGLTNHATQATAANMAIGRMVAFNGRPSLDFGAGTAFGYATPSVSLSGAHFIFAIVRGDASCGYVIVHVADSGPGSFLFGSSSGASLVRRTNYSFRNVTAANWLRDATRHTAGYTCDGTINAGHVLYRDGAVEPSTDSASTGNPGTGATAGPLYIGNNQSLTNSIRGLLAGWVVGTGAVSAVDMRRLYEYAIRRFPL